MIQVRNLYKVFRDSEGDTLEALCGVDLEVRAGQICGIVGLSGAGKSTLLRCLNRLENPSSGTVTLDGCDVCSVTEKELLKLRRHVGMIFQHFNLLWSRSVAQNVAFPLQLEGWRQQDIDKRVDEVLRLVGLIDKKDSYPSQLSGGQKQRVAIARALANLPSVLLCDEATSALDPQTTKSILELIARINVELGLTVVLITHEMEVVREICHWVAVMESGQIVEQGPVKQIFMAPKSETARSFLRGLPRRGYDLEDLPKTSGCPLAKLSFGCDASQEPVISRTVRHCGVDVNILSGEIDHLYSSRVGTLVVQFIGSKEAIEHTMDYLRDNDVQVEVIWHG